MSRLLSFFSSAIALPCWPAFAHAQGELNEAASVASAEAEQAQLIRSWEAPEDCIRESELRDQVAGELSTEMRQRSIDGQLEATEEGWTATLIVFEAENRLGQRVLELSGEDCRAHDDTLALVVALLLEHGPPPPEEGEEPVAKEPAHPEPPLAEPSPPEVKEPDTTSKPEEQEPSEPSPRLRIGAGLRVLGGWTPQLSWGPTLHLGALFRERWALDVVGDYYPLTNVAVEPEGSVHLGGGRVQIRTCVLPWAGVFQGTACVGAGWMGLSGSGQEVAESRTAFLSSPVVSGELGALWNWSSRWAVVS